MIMKKLIIFSLLLMTSLAVNAQRREVRMPERPQMHGYKDYSMQDKGFWCAVEAEGGSSVMASSPNMQYANLSFTGGYRFSEYLRVGAGLGCRMYVNNADVRDTDNKFGVPIYANVRGNFISAYDRDGVPFWSVNIGGITNDGFFASPTVGYSFGGLRNNFQIGISYTFTNFTNSSKKDCCYSYFGLKLGYEF